MICLLRQIERSMVFILSIGITIRNPQILAAQGELAYRLSVQFFLHKHWILLTVESIFYLRDTRFESWESMKNAL
jgi:hypothetical protein